VTHARVFERFLDARDTGTSLFNDGRTNEPDLSDVIRVEVTEIRSGEIGVAREGRRSPSVFRTYNGHACSRQTGILPSRLELPFERRRRWYPWREPQKRWAGATVG
jgi:hypothetical protein